ncbi:MAG: HD domain-containing protein, partial [bacterium]
LENCVTIATDLDWETDRIAAAGVLGLLHDVGRFPQFQKYHTLVDSQSVDHGELGRKIVSDLFLLSSSGPAERSDIMCAICHHNKRDLPAGAGPGALALLKLVRDADKLDIIRTLNELLRTDGFSRYPELLLNVDQYGPANPSLIDDIACCRPGSYSKVKSLADMQLMQLSWIYDLNYPTTFHLLISRGLLAAIKQRLPDAEGVDRITVAAEKYAVKQAGLSRVSLASDHESSAADRRISP